MFSPRALLPAACLILPHAALAQVTADEIWAAWQDGGPGVTTTAQVQRDGSDLSLADLSVEIADEDGGRTVMAIDRVEMTDRSDGTVAIRAPGSATISRDDMPDVAVILDLETTEVTVSRADGTLSYDALSPTLPLRVEGPELPAPIEALVNGAETTLELAPDALTVSSRSEGVGVTGLFPGDSGTVNFQLVTGPSEGTTRAETVAGLFASGGEGGAGAFEAEQSTQDILVRLTGGLGGGAEAVELAIAETSIATRSAPARQGTEGTLGGVELSAALAPGAPVQVLGTLDRLEWSGTIPGAAAEDEQTELGLSLSVVALAPSETAWETFDPSGFLARTPLNLTAEISGTGQLVHPGLPVLLAYELSELTLETLSLSALGASITGGGSVTAPLDPPARSGQLSFIGTGLLELIGDLGQTGLLPPGQDVGARMGLMFLTEPEPDGEGLRSDVTFGPDGAISVNGTRLRLSLIHI